ncbi:GntR family transcriptional regulator [Gottschalkiaceae bacterium SANA]|nr:GntR family transcriptional regulator [Gottschalkiaceae bacterium SANA]
MTEESWRIYSIILKRIIEIEYVPGELLSENSLAEEFGISRTPIREILIKLSEKGFVKLMPRVGTYVSEIDAREMISIFEVRKTLEILACELAIMRSTEEQSQKLFSVVEQIKSLNDQARYRECVKEEYEFLNMIASASKNVYVEEYLQELNSKILRFVNYVQYEKHLSERMINALVSITKAISRRDSENASKEMTRYMLAHVNELTQCLLTKLFFD